MSKPEFLPPGEHPYDPSNSDIDPVGYALERLQTYLTWIEEYRASFEKYRQTDSESVDRELQYLAHSTKEAIRHFVRLTELLLLGVKINPEKRLPRTLFQSNWLSGVNTWLKKTENGKDSDSQS